VRQEDQLARTEGYVALDLVATYNALGGGRATERSEKVKTMKIYTSVWTFIALAIAAGCGQEAERSVMPTRPVTVIVLSEQEHARERSLTGVVNLYREEEIGFEIGGRVTTVLDEGIEVRGPAFDEDGELVRRGDPIAAMESGRYGSKVGALQARLDAARRNLQAVQAQVTLTRQTLERQKALLAKGAGAQQAVDDAQGAFDQSAAQLAAQRATVQEVARQLDSATEDLGDAVLFAPFSGRITKVHISEGAVVSAGTPVITLTLMDPVRIQVEVSADDERDIETGDRAMIWPKDPLRGGERIPVNAIVFEKSAVADPALRTFRIDMIARNLRRHVDQLNPELSGLPIINEYLPIVREYQGEEGPLFVPIDSILFEDDDAYVLRLPGVSFHSGGRRSAVGKHIPEKIGISLGDQYTTVVNWNFRSIVAHGDLAEGDFLILNPLPGYIDGVAGGRPQWLLRPRDLIPVRFDLSATTPGFYVPNHAIMLAGDSPMVFVVENGIARARPVSLHESHGELRRIEGEGLAIGSEVIVGGVHYVSDGQPVIVAATVQSS
jgi:RND family efflux transporter MFP subunit